MSPGPRLPTRRLFLALWPTAKERLALAASTAAMVQASGARAVPPENLHLTLAFLGAVPTGRTAELVCLSAQLAAAWEAGPVALSWTRLEYWQRPQILAAVTATPCVRAAQLATRLKHAAYRDAIPIAAWLYRHPAQQASAHAEVLRRSDAGA